MVAKQQTNHTRFAKSSKAGFDQILEFFATEDFSKLGQALECFKEAESMAGTNKERFFCGRMRTLVRLMA